MNKSSVKAALSIFLLIIPAGAFVPAPTTQRAVIGSSFYPSPSPAKIMCHSTQDRKSTKSTQLFEQPSTSTSASDVGTANSSILYDFTTFIGKSASSFVSVSFFLLLAYHRDSLLVTLFVGSIINSVWGKILKKILNHERPAELQLNENVKLKPSDGGMPSSHAMSLGFIGAAILMGVVPVENQAIVGSIMAAYSAIALRYRVRDHLHTLEQVGVGLVLGVGNALAWLKYGVGERNNVGPVVSWVQDHWMSAETGLLPYPALAIPVAVGILVVGSFERRIARWLKDKQS